VSNTTGILEKILSGGQTGVDRAALDWAIMNNIDHGGWCPRHRKANDGTIAPHYRLQETESAGYSQRTRLNVQEADATLILGRGQLVGGSHLTWRFAHELGKPVHVVDLTLDWPEQIEGFKQWLTRLTVRSLNVAGPSESRCPGIYLQGKNFLIYSKILSTRP
jgi:hypothetical protein